jgi:hypothetical protein
MTEIKSEFIFQLSTPIYYQEDGDARVEARELTLKAPSNKQRRESAELKQGFMRTLKAMANDSGDVEVDANAKGADKKETGSDEILSIMMMSKEVDFVDYQESFRKLLLNDIAWITEKQRLTSPLYDTLSDEDTDRLLGEYLSTFLLSSLMSKLQG